MDSELEVRVEELLEKGKAFASGIARYEGDPDYWFSDDGIPDLQAWIASVANIFRLLATPDTYFYQECNRVLEQDDLRRGVPYHVVQKLLCLLESLLEDMRRGLLRKAEYIFVASTFDDFLDHATEYHKAGKKEESSVLASAVFEDSVRKIAIKNGIHQSAVALDNIIDELVKASVLTPVKAKRIKGYAAIRNKALHAQWSDFDLRDVGEMIKGTREIIETLL